MTLYMSTVAAASDQRLDWRASGQPLCKPATPRGVRAGLGAAGASAVVPPVALGSAASVGSANSAPEAIWVEWPGRPRPMCPLPSTPPRDASMGTIVDTGHDVDTGRLETPRDMEPSPREYPRIVDRPLSMRSVDISLSTTRPPSLDRDASRGSYSLQPAGSSRSGKQQGASAERTWQERLLDWFSFGPYPCCTDDAGGRDSDTMCRRPRRSTAEVTFSVQDVRTTGEGEVVGLAVDDLPFFTSRPLALDSPTNYVHGGELGAQIEEDESIVSFGQVVTTGGHRCWNVAQEGCHCGPAVRPASATVETTIVADSPCRTDDGSAKLILPIAMKTDASSVPGNLKGGRRGGA
eukprot:TRINITY_DN34702_c0_g1_i1.p1 TRINITY_DN34702_c0_g1~~TRINITY_DN34702_c0_g1_i1.p1  ORF type:complete len:350 (-),score=50.22 TRINITY_DN34702_c0_g1_i1:171-1220(-)